MKISLLPEEVFSRIAAGEVVERPLSVVKEAVENSLDGGATEIKVSLFEGGKMRIVVEDNGRGIPFDELPLAAAPHATSKLRTIEELEAVSSLGFRGEALASISAVSRFELRSRAEGEESGGLLKIEGGKQVLHTPIPCRPGTRLSVEDLFYNLPARRKFLKSSAAESRRVFSFLREMAVAYPEVAFSEESDGKKGFSSSGKGSREDVLRLLWGGEGTIRRCDTASAHLSLESWFMPCPGRARSTAVTFVNGRSVNDPLLRGATGSLCRTLVGNWVFFFTLPADLLDVNIHPAKWEIRFRYPGEVYDTVQQAVLTLSGSAPSLAPGDFSPEKGRGASRGGVFKGGRAYPSEKAGRDGGESLFGRVSSPPSSLEEGERKEDSPFPEKPGGEIRFLGQIASGYLLFETEEGVALMDPHAAHERIGYERAQKLSKDSLTLSRCALPLPVPPSLSLAVSGHRQALEDIGFSFSSEEGSLLLEGYPSLPGGLGEDPLRLLRSVLTEWTEDRTAPLEEVLWKRLATAACGLSVKLTTRLSPSEALALWRSLQLCEAPWTCPHGRPTVLALDSGKLQSFFGRE